MFWFFILRNGHDARSSSLMLVDFKCLWDLHQTVVWLQDCAICCEVRWENTVFAGTVYLESADNQFVQVTLPLSGYLKTSSFWCQNSNTFLFVTNQPKLDELEKIDLTKYKVFQAKICLLLQFKISDIVFVFSLITAGLTTRNGHTKIMSCKIKSATTDPMYERLLLKRIQWWEDTFHIFNFGKFILKIDEKCSIKCIPAHLDAPGQKT